jgi:uncharacterized short protein YbdD (DUF466 family)
MRAATNTPARGSGVARLRSALRSLGSALRIVTGAPDYERYRRHLAARHPGVEPLSRDTFVREQLERRYARPGSRCC